MFPDSIPVFTPDDIIEPPAQEYEDGEQRSFVGWLKHLFLYSQCEDNPDCLQITEQDRKDFKKVLDTTRKQCIMKHGETLNDWEDRTTRKTQASVLNKVREQLGYTEEFYYE